MKFVVNNIEDIKNINKLCTGCRTCELVCPMNCISFSYSNDGFLYPKIDSSKCIDCSNCIRYCGVYNKKNDVDVRRIYSCQAKNSAILNSCSSGGVFRLLAEKIISTGGIVYGAVFDKNTKTVIHVSSNETKINEIYRSKYVQSDVSNIYEDVANNLLQNKVVLFSGTPCEIRGLKFYLKYRRVVGKLITVDFKCHGVPSPLYYRNLIIDLETKNNSKITDLTFREKLYGWKNLALKAYFENGKTEINRANENYFFYSFLNNYSLRDSCYTCHEYASHVSDLTLADDWVTTSFKDDKGSSLVFINTNEGEEFFFTIINDLFYYEIETKNFNYEFYSHNKYIFHNKKTWKKKILRFGFAYHPENIKRNSYSVKKFIYSILVNNKKH